MRIIPVLDVRAGIVVHAVGGDRRLYHPLVSKLTPENSPLSVALAFRQHFGLTTLYVADLQALMGGFPDFELVRQLHAAGLNLWVDAAIHTTERAAKLLAAGVTKVIVAGETLPSWSPLESIAALATSERLIFSLDLWQGVPLGPCGSPVPSSGWIKHGK